MQIRKYLIVCVLYSNVILSMNSEANASFELLKKIVVTPKMRNDRLLATIAADDPGCMAYLEAVRMGNDQEAITLINAGFPIDAELEGANGNALAFACRQGRHNVAQALLERGATLRQDSFKLHEVVKHPLVVQLLLEREIVSPNAIKNSYNLEPALVNAIDGNHIATVGILLMHKADVNQRFYRDTCVLSPLTLARQKKSNRSIIALLEKYNAQEFKTETGISEFDRIMQDQYAETPDV